MPNIIMAAAGDGDILKKIICNTNSKADVEIIA
jgi:hypothetical protein